MVSEREASSAVQRVLKLRESGAARMGEAVSAAEAAVADHYLLLRARALIPATAADALSERAAGVSQSQRFVDLLCGESGGGGGGGGSGGGGGGGGGGGSAGAACAARAPAAAPPAAADALAPLLQLRASLAADVARLAASHEAISRDKRVLGAATALHGELARDAAESNELARAWAEKGRREVRWVAAAAALLIATAAYITLRRVAWLFGVRVP
jgi:hypothetical protein